MSVGKKSDILAFLKGSFSKDYYARKHPDPELLILQHRPCRRLRRGQSPHPELARTNQVMLVAKEKAKTIYHDPVLRTQKQAEFNALQERCKKKGNRHINGGKCAGGYELPFTLWAWIYGECLRAEYAQTKIGTT